MRVIGLLAPGPSPPKALVASPSLATGALFNIDIHGGAIHTIMTDATSVHRFVGRERVAGIAGVYEAGVAAVA